LAASRALNIDGMDGSSAATARLQANRPPDKHRCGQAPLLVQLRRPCRLHLARAGQGSEPDSPVDHPALRHLCCGAARRYSAIGASSSPFQDEHQIGMRDREFGIKGDRPRRNMRFQPGSAICRGRGHRLPLPILARVHGRRARPAGNSGSARESSSRACRARPHRGRTSRRLPAMLVTTGMSKPSTRSKTTTGLRPARSSSKTVAVMSSPRSGHSGGRFQPSRETRACSACPRSPSLRRDQASGTTPRHDRATAANERSPSGRPVRYAVRRYRSGARSCGR
jgi:hypothetical protein